MHQEQLLDSYDKINVQYAANSIMPVQLWVKSQSALAIYSIVSITSCIVSKVSDVFKRNLPCVQLSKFPTGILKK